MAVEGLSIGPYLDHNAHPWLARDLRPQGFSVTVAADVGNRLASDEEHHRWATERGLTVLTFDVKDYPNLAQRWAEQGRQHAGIIVAVAPPRITYGQLLRRLRAFLDAVSADEMVNQVRWLDASWDRDG